MDLKMEVYSPFLELLGLLEIQNSVLWTRKAFSAGSFSLQSLITDESRSLLAPENIIWIAGEYAGIIEYIQQEAGGSGPYITVKGSDLTGILDRCILWGQYDLIGPVPELMYRLVDDCCIHPTRGEPVEVRVIPGLVLSDAPGGGISIRSQKTGGTLLEALEELGETYRVPFGVRFNPKVPRMEFWARPGMDRSIHQAVNEPVFYSTELDDVLDSQYSYNAQNYRNIALVAGEGEGGSRTMVTVMGTMEPQPEPPAPAVRYTITLAVDPEGGGVASGGGTVEEGKSVTVTASPAGGFAFAGWQENGTIVSTSAAYTFKASGDRTLTAVFAVIVPTYTVSVSVDPAGSGTVTGGGTYQEGTSVTVKAEPGEEYKFAAWQESGQTVSEDTEYTFTVNGDRELVAVFEVKKASRLPEGYTEVEYLHWDGINTSFVLLENVKANADRVVLSFMPETFSGYILFVNGKSGTTTYYLSLFVTNNTTLSYMIDFNSVKTISIDAGGLLNFDIDFYSHSFTVNGLKLNGNWSGRSLGSTNKMLGRNGSTSVQGKFYQFTQYRNNEVIHDYVPCINPDGAAGIFDMNTETFIQNTHAGATTITPGPAV